MPIGSLIREENGFSFIKFEVDIFKNLNSKVRLESTLRGNKKASHFCEALYLLVVPPGLEPGTT